MAGIAAGWALAAAGATSTATGWRCWPSSRSRYADGTTERIVTDERWRAARGPILASDIYDGETYDARLERPGWSAAGLRRPRLGGRAAARPRPGDPGRADRARRCGAPSWSPRSPSRTSPSGRTIVDFGQNLVGRLRLTVQGQAGQTITLRHAEVLENGELATRPLRHAQATDRYTLRGGEAETWEPRFTFHGFRYAEVDGWPGELQRR